jgi:tRNA uridine 5-carboxymethylaminomethyl modification enzyme
MLNSSKGYAVQGPRAQADRELYRKNIQDELDNTPNLTVKEGTVEDLILTDTNQKDNGYVTKVDGIILKSGEKINSHSVVLTTGTFLGGTVHIGNKSFSSGRIGEAATHGLANTLRDRLKFPLDYMRTGTPPRLDGRTIDYTNLEPQQSDDPAQPFSFLSEKVDQSANFIKCHMTRTTFETQKIVSDNMHLSPKLIGGEGGMGNGPRYVVTNFFEILIIFEKILPIS